MERALGGTADTLAAPLLIRLKEHGFFSHPRPAEPVSPTVQLQLTNECNLACQYCCTNSGDPRAREITFDMARSVVEEAREVLGAGARVALLGGEPLEVPWCVDLGQVILDLGLHLTLFTNGTLLSRPGMAEAVAGLQRRGAEIRVSLSGPNAETCDALSGRPSFDATLTGIKALALLDCSPAVDLMLLPETVETVVQEMRSLRRALGKGPKIALGLLYDSGREHGDRLFPSRAVLDEALDQITFEGGCAVPIAERKPVAWRREGCTCALGHHLHVRSDGALFACFRMEEPVGRLGGEGFDEVLTRVRENPHRAADLATCRDCQLATICGGGCRSENYRYSGNPDEPPCGPWRVRTICELLAEDRVDAVSWPLHHLLAEAHARGIDAPDRLNTAVTSRHLSDVV